MVLKPASNEALVCVLLSRGKDNKDSSSTHAEGHEQQYTFF